MTPDEYSVAVSAVADRLTDRSIPALTTTPMMSSSRITSSSSPSTLTVWPEYLPNSTLSPTLTSSGDDLAVVVDLAVADGHDFALIGLLGGGVGNHDAGSGLALFVEALDDHAIVQRPDFHEISCQIAKVETKSGRIRTAVARETGLALTATDC